MHSQLLFYPLVMTDTDLSFQEGFCTHGGVIIKHSEIRWPIVFSVVVTESTFVFRTGIREIVLVVSGCGPVLQNKQFSSTLKSWNLFSLSYNIHYYCVWYHFAMSKQGTEEELFMHSWDFLFRWRASCILYCTLPCKVIFCISRMLICPGILLAWFSVPFFIIPSAPIMTGINIVLSFHIVVTSI